MPHAFLNTTEEPGEIVVVYTPGGGHKFYEELGPLTREGTPDRAAVAAVFEKHNMTLLGPPSPTTRHLQEIAMSPWRCSVVRPMSEDAIRSAYESLIAVGVEPMVALMDTSMEWRRRRRTRF